MADPDMQPGGEMPFDGKRMFWGGFNPILNTLEMRRWPIRTAASSGTS